MPFPIGKLAGFVASHPYATGASIFAPLFAKNEDRGYFRTSLITTPAIFAASAFVPNLFGGVKDLTRAAIGARNSVRASKAAAQNSVNRTVSEFLVAEHRTRDYIKEQRILNKYFNRKFVVTPYLVDKINQGDLSALRRANEIDAIQLTKGELLSNAMHFARRSSLTPSEWELETGEFPLLDNEGLIDMFQKYESRPKFRTALKGRLKELVGKNALTYTGTVAEAQTLPVSTINSTLVFGDADPIWDAASINLRNQAPSLIDYLKTARERNFIRGDINIEAAKDVVTGKVGRVLNVKVNRPGNVKPLEIPVVDPSTGQVRLFASKQVGVGNYVIGPDLQPYRIDEWIAKQLAENPAFTNEQLQDEINAHAYWMSGDPLDARRMGELSALEGGQSTLNTQAIKLRSHAAGMTKLPLFEVDGKKLSFQDFEFGSDRKVNIIKNLANSNKYIAMSSESALAEGRFVLREAANLSPFGAPSAEKQDYIWRSVTKEFHLNAPNGIPIEARLGWRSSAWEQLTGSPDLPAAQFNVASINPQDRTALLGQFEELGRMGETGFLVNEGFANNFNVAGNIKYNVDRLGVKIGDKLDPDQVIGFNKGDRVVPNFSGTVADVVKTDDGYSVIMQHELNMQGAKVDIAGIKGMVPKTVADARFQQIRESINEYYKKSGSPNFIPESANVLAPAEYFANKADPAASYLGMSSDLVRRLDKPGSQAITADFLSKASDMGIAYTDGQLVIDASKNQIANSKATADKLRQFSEICEEFFAKAGEAIKKAGGYQDPVLTAYVQSGKKLGDWMRKNSLPAIAFAWDHSMVNMPRTSKIGYDFETYMALGNNLKGLRAVQSRLQTVTGGNPNQTLEFLDYLIKGDYKQDFGNTISIKDAFLSKGSLNEASNRAGSIFDPDKFEYRKNFRLDLGNGRYLPVPGTEAYGAESNLFEPGRYHTADWQKALQGLASAETPEEAAKIEASMKSLYIKELGIGKGSAIRPNQFDPLGVPGFLSTIDGGNDPFIARVSPEWVDRVHSARLRQDLQAGQDIIGILHRQPTNELMYLKYRMDPSMKNTMDVAVPESVSRALMGDQDKDLVNSILFDANIRMQNNKLIVTSAANQLEREAAEEAIEAMSGRQNQRLAIWQSLKGDEEIAARASIDWRLTSLAASNEKFASAVEDRTGKAISRTASAAIGSYSNVLTGMVEDMVRNPVIMRDPDLVQRLKTGLFDIRQAPISARKVGGFSLDVAMRKVDLLRKGLAADNPNTAFRLIHNELLDMSEKLIGPDSREYKYWAAQGAEDLKQWAFGRSEKARLAAAAFTSNSNTPTSVIEKVFNEGVGEVLGPVHTSTMANKSASTLGAMSDILAEEGSSIARGIGSRARQVFSEHGVSMAIGLGALAALGVAMTPRTPVVASFSRSSGNSYRPESMGTPDSIPGEPIPGDMAPGAPPRRIVGNQQGVRTAIVAPLRRTSDLMVRMSATDRSRAADTARLLAQIPGSGDTSVTINYRDRTRLGSLRTREKIREIRT